MLKSTERKIRKIVNEMIGRKFYGSRVAMPYYSGGGGGDVTWEEIRGDSPADNSAFASYMVINYYNIKDIDGQIAPIIARLENVEDDVQLKQNITDEDLETVTKTIVGAINEVNIKASADNNYVIDLENNHDFISTNDTITATQIVTTSGTTILSSNLKIGSSIYNTDPAVPDRWYGGNDTFYKVVGEKLDLHLYQQKTDYDLETDSKSVVGAINEVNRNFKNRHLYGYSQITTLSNPTTEPATKYRLTFYDYITTAVGKYSDNWLLFDEFIEDLAKDIEIGESVRVNFDGSLVDIIDEQNPIQYEIQHLEITKQETWTNYTINFYCLNVETREGIDIPIITRGLQSTTSGTRRTIF